jgi:hypothetical protein
MLGKQADGEVMASCPRGQAGEFKDQVMLSPTLKLEIPKRLDKRNPQRSSN